MGGPLDVPEAHAAKLQIRPLHFLQLAEVIRDNVMESARTNEAGSGHRNSPHELVKLIRKLRWMALDDEARRLELAVSTLPPEERDTVSIGPFTPTKSPA